MEINLMPQRALRQVMSVQDIYAYAEPIMQMLREAYGSYDADVLDEVQVDDSFVQRLQSRGYELRVPVEPAPSDAAPPEPGVVAPRRRTATTANSSPAPTSAPPVSPAPASSAPSPTANSAGPASTSSDTPRPATRTRRAATPTAATGDVPAPTTTRRSTGTAAGRTTMPRRTTRTARASSDGEAE